MFVPARPIEHGRVLCPVRAEDVDTDACFACGYLVSRSDEPDGGGQLRCRPPRGHALKRDSLASYVPTL